ncbi:MAG: EVE domain-containing protein [Gammaproteobacteria bacterium]|nr:EVE domain-containing protein [Gammaproteobacteria bacterium]
MAITASGHTPVVHPNTAPSARKYWIGVVSLAHVKRGVAGGFAQVCHGKAAPLRRMNVGDWFVYYSPKTDMSDGEPLQMFTAIGRVGGETTYEYAMAPDFVPFRRDIIYLTGKPAPIQPLIPQLSFIRDPKRWGYPFRMGHFEMTQHDCQLIAQAMAVRFDD